MMMCPPHVSAVSSLPPHSAAATIAAVATQDEDDDLAAADGIEDGQPAGIGRRG